MIVSDCSFEFKQSVVNSDFLHRGTATVSKDAYVDLNDPDFPIIPEVYGTNSDTEKFFNQLIHHIQLGELQFVFDERDYLTMPKITADDDELIEYQKYCRKYLKQRITYKMGKETFTLTAKQIDKLLTDDLSGNADEEAVTEYVRALAEKYDNVGAERNFTSLTGKNVTVSGGTYGWMIDQEKETDGLMKAILGGQTDVRTPVYQQEARERDTNDIGYTYIEIDKENDQFVLYVDGNPVIQTAGRSSAMEGGVYSLKTPVSESYGKLWYLPFGSGQCVYGTDLGIGESSVNEMDDLLGQLDDLTPEPTEMPAEIEDGCFAIQNESAEAAFPQCTEGMPVIVY